MEVIMKQCSICKIERNSVMFVSTAGRILKSCSRCRDMKQASANKYKCEHNRRKNLCKDCQGVSICEHNKRKIRCKDCHGSSICEHNRQKSICKDCHGASICEHNRERSKCKDCHGASICEHNRERYKCKDCHGASICEHNRIKSTCKDCGGVSICIHQKQKSQCKECSNPIKVTIKHMINHSKKTDIQKNKYDANNFIDKCFIEQLIDESTMCYYCQCQMQFIEYNDTLCTIERLDNSIGHIKSNCVLACKKCNCSRVGQK